MLALNNIPDDSVVSSNSAGFTSSPLVYSFPSRYREAYYRELEHFLDVVLDPSQPLLVQEDDTIRCSRVASACEKSSKSKKMEKPFM